MTGPTGAAGAQRGAAGSTRRQFLLGGAAAGAGAAAALALEAATDKSVPDSPPASIGGDTIPFHGIHQAGIATPATAHVLYVALDLRQNVDRGALSRLMRLLTDDAVRLTQGRGALADTEPELAVAPARLTVTFGFGPAFVDRAGAAAPPWLGPLPAFSVDRLRPEFSDGDLLIQIAADDLVTVAHASRVLLKDARAFASVRWTQAGFRRSRGSEPEGTTMRNLFGQVDGTSNPTPGTPAFDAAVWATDGWMTGGTGLVLRRISMDLDGWDRMDRPGRDEVIGRFQSNGAPLTSDPTDPAAEFDEPDFTATTPLGFPVISASSHLARARTTGAVIYRRAYNYETPAVGAMPADAGLLFASYQADVEAQFVPIQRALDELDMLNRWTTPIGSAVFAIPPGCDEGGFIGDSLLA